MATSYLTGQRLTADLLNTNTTAFMPTQTVKGGTTSRNTTTTLTADPDLSGIALGVGTYRIEVGLYFTVAAAANGGLRTQWSFSGTWNNPTRACSGPGANLTGVSTTGPSRIPEMTSITYTSTQNADYQMGNTTTARTRVLEDCANVVVTVAGSMSVTWAQTTSNANNTNIHAESFVRVTRLA
jgi:hypothetical protein